MKSKKSPRKASYARFVQIVAEAELAWDELLTGRQLGLTEDGG